MIHIIPVQSRSDLKRFIRFPWTLYGNDPCWVPPLISKVKKLLDPKKNPFFEHATAQLFLAEKDGTVVGRISAQIDFLHNQTHAEKTGFFGFFESIDDLSVAKALLAKAGEWIREKGMDKVRGPFNFSINDECGTLVDGFNHPPFILTAHNPAYYPALLEGAGLRKIKDLYCWRYECGQGIPEPAQAIADEVRKYPGLVIREVSKKNIEHDLGIVIDIFNESWKRNWGFVPLTKNEIKKAANDFKMILEPKLALIAEVNGVPAAISLALPNLNEAIADLNGRLFPFGIFKLLYRLKTHKIKSARQILLGIKKEFRGDVLGGLSVLLYAEMSRRGKELGLWGGECSWTLEDNTKINTGIGLMGGKHYKTYRIYEATI